MSLAFYLDHHVPAAIADGLRQLQVDVLTVAEDGKADWDDDQLLERALELGRIVFTQDRDFLVLAARWQTCGTVSSFCHCESAGTRRKPS